MAASLWSEASTQISAEWIALSTGAVSHPERRTRDQILASGDVLRALTVLLDLALLQPEYPNIYEMAKQVGTQAMDDHQPGSFPVTYKLTEIGRAVIMEIFVQHGGAQMIEDPDLRAKLDKYFSELQTYGTGDWLLP